MATKIMRSTKHGTMPSGSLWETCLKCGRSLYFCYIDKGVCDYCKNNLGLIDPRD